MNCAGSLRWRACSKMPAVSTSLTTSATSAGTLPAVMASAIAMKFEPLPEPSTPRRNVPPGVATRLTHSHTQQEFDVALGFLELVQHQFHGLDRRHARESAAQQDDAIQLVRMIEQFLFACARALDVDGRENPAVHERAVKVDLH